MALIPRNIKTHILHPGDTGQIRGFEELFVYLEITPVALELRQLVVTYFAESPALRSHLSAYAMSLGPEPVFGSRNPIGTFQDRLLPPPLKMNAVAQQHAHRERLPQRRSPCHRKLRRPLQISLSPGPPMRLRKEITGIS